MENIKKKYIMWFIVLTARYESNPKAIVWNSSEKLMSVKIHALKKASVAKLYIAFVDILRSNEKLVSLIW